MSTPITTAPTQVAHPFKAVLRTIFQNIVVWVPAAILAAPMLSDFIEANFPGTPVPAAIITGTAFLIALTGLVARLMAIPQINDAFTKVGLGAEPKAVSQTVVEQYHSILNNNIKEATTESVISEIAKTDRELAEEIAGRINLIDAGHGK
jgi:hypothetical protein